MFHAAVLTKERKWSWYLAFYLWRLAMLMVWVFSAVSIVEAAAEFGGDSFPAASRGSGSSGHGRGSPKRPGTNHTGELEPRFVPMNVRKDKELPALKKGDRVEITVNEQNLLVDVHVLGESSHHRVVRGQLAGPLETGHDKVVIRTTNGKEESHWIRPVARSKVASVPPGVDAVFLIDELNKVVDVVFANQAAVQRAEELWQKTTPLKGNLSRIVGVVLKPLHDNSLTIRTDGGKEQRYEVRPLIQSRVATLSQGDAVVLLVDEENKVTDVAFVPGGKP
jgi:hypothetical protein